jgi:anti-anti-sigma factor
VFVSQERVDVAALIEMSRALRVNTRDTRGRSHEIRARSRRLRRQEPCSVVHRSPEPSAAVTTAVGRTTSGIVVHVAGEIDMLSTPTFVAVLEPHLDALTPGAEVIVDLSDVTLIDLHGVAVLLAATETARSSGATFRVVGCPPRLRRLLRHSGVDATLAPE